VSTGDDVSVDNQKTATMSIRLSSQELAIAKDRAQSAGESLSNFARSLLLSGEVRDQRTLPVSQSVSGLVGYGNFALEWDGREIVSNSTESIITFS